MEQNPGGSGTTFADGYDSGRNGETRTANPHMAYSIAEMHWFLGWDQGSEKLALVNAQTDPDAPSRG